MKYSDIPSWEENTEDESKYEVVFDIHTDELKDIAIDLGSNIKNDKVLVHRVYAELGGGGPELWLNFVHIVQPVLKFMGMAVATAVITDLYNNDKALLKKLYKKLNSRSAPVLDDDWNKHLPLFHEVFGPNNSSLQFRFLSSFDEDEYMDAWGAIPAALKISAFIDNTSHIYLFNTKKKEWFIEGHFSHKNDI
jgi:hypothetical protein